MNAKTPNQVPLNWKTTVTPEEGMQLYSCGRYTVMKLAKEAGAVIHCGRIVLINTRKMNEHLDELSE